MSSKAIAVTPPPLQTTTPTQRMQSAIPSLPISNVEQGNSSNTPTPPDDNATTEDAHHTQQEASPLLGCVYVDDDFCGIAQEGNQWTTRRAIKKRVLFQLLDKKMFKGDATWNTKKAILGWLIDSNPSIKPPAFLPTESNGYKKSSASFLFPQPPILLGELLLQSMTSLAIPAGSRDLFSILQEAFQHTRRSPAGATNSGSPPKGSIYDASAVESLRAEVVAESS
eukprot:jgi/Psemu1/19389/gm1.19389_g